MPHRLRAPARRLHVNEQVLLDLALPDVLSQPFRPQRLLEGIIVSARLRRLQDHLPLGALQNHSDMIPQARYNLTMSQKKHFKRTALTFIAILLAIGATDALLLENKLLESPQQSETAEGEEDASLPPGAVRKGSGPNVLRVLEKEGLKATDTSERTLIDQIIPHEEVAVETRALLKQSDRVGLIAWVDSPAVTKYFLALKEALHASFSPDVTDLIDEEQQRPGKPKRSLLTFLDPGLSEERIVFLRIRQRLYELHIAEGKEEMVFELIEELTR